MQIGQSALTLRDRLHGALAAAADGMRKISPADLKPPVVGSLLLFCSVLLLESASLHFMGNTTPVWLTNAVIVSALLRNAVPRWPALLLVGMSADIASGLLNGDAVATATGTALVDALEITIVSSFLRRAEDRAPIFSNLRQISRFATVCMTVPVLSSFGGAAILSLQFGSDFFQVWFNWYVAGVFGLLIVTPFILLWTDPSQRLTIAPRDIWEVLALGLLVGAVGWIDFSVRALPGTYLCFPFLLLAAFRGGMLGATTGAVVLTAVSTFLTIRGAGLTDAFPGVDINERILLLQLYLGFVLLSTLPVAVILEHRKLLNAAQALADLSRMGRHDVLTDLPNRVLFHEQLAAIQEKAAKGGGNTALLLLDLDRFKPVNDVHGHGAGDTLLQLVAQRISAAVREGDTVARLGGDEFAIVSYIHRADTAEFLAERIISSIEKPFEFRGLSVQIGCSIGIGLSREGATTDATLIQQADAALYSAKAAGRNSYRFYEAGQDLKIRERAELELEFRRAVAQQEIVPHFQPIVALPDSRLVGFEMLARWVHPVRGNIPPMVFIPLAEAIGLIGPLTDQLLRQACMAALTWPDHTYVSANVSPVQLRDRRLPTLIQSVLIDTGLAPNRFEIELTETALIDDFEFASEILVKLKAVGVSLALDDFGTGYSSLRHLQHLPLDKIKIDMDFVRTMTTTSASRKIVAGVIGLGHSLGLRVVAEGIEDMAIRDVLQQMGCDLGQGWLFGKAVPLDEAMALLAADRMRESSPMPAADSSDRE